jgi:hypothetical protein
MPTRVLVVGSGGREHALAWKLAAEPGVNAVVVTPGSAAMTREDRVAIRPGVDPLDPAAITAWTIAHCLALFCGSVLAGMAKRGRPQRSLSACKALRTVLRLRPRPNFLLSAKTNMATVHKVAR